MHSNFRSDISGCPGPPVQQAYNKSTTEQVEFVIIKNFCFVFPQKSMQKSIFAFSAKIIFESAIHKNDENFGDIGEIFFSFKGLVASCHSFSFYFTVSEHTYNIYIYNSSRTASCYLHRFRSVEGLLWGAEPRFKLGHALQRADTLLFVPSCTLAKIPRLLFCYILNQNHTKFV